ncbi:hypothetical protein [Pseudarthrobacter phenanthrenivorans]|uniref:Uncharacterized protein n=1 Tax=Pseudarthrobacter phenanthrenivorans TaxID=361575 RepID=A0A0B4DHZ3_PSEPS|nr:hypothetical protein [Pseudarthrobacter phenanthrenivorans]KIC66311.1 hypothetical protein RM50_12315 [Pseudarthrobacter phenanthrenivorans]
MAQRNVAVRFTAEIQGFKAAMAEAAAATEKTKKATEDAGKTADTHMGKLVQSATQNRDAWEQTGAVVAGFGAATVAGVTGGRVRDIMGFAEGGIVPGTAPSDPTQDNVLAMVNGQPLKVRSGEWIINEKSSRRYDGVLAAINAGTFRGYAEGGRVGAVQAGVSVAAPAFPSSLRLVVDGHEFTAYVDGRVGSGMERVATVANGRSR